MSLQGSICFMGEKVTVSKFQPVKLFRDEAVESFTNNSAIVGDFSKSSSKKVNVTWGVVQLVEHMPVGKIDLIWLVHPVAYSGHSTIFPELIVSR